MVRTINVYVDTAAVICDRAFLPELSDDGLQGVQISVLKDRGDELHFVFIVAAPADPALRTDGRVSLDLPVTALAVTDRLSVVASACRCAGSAVEDLCHDVGCHPSGDACEFDFDSVVLVLDKF